MLLIYHIYWIRQAILGIFLHLNFIDYQRFTKNILKKSKICPPFLKKLKTGDFENGRGGTKIILP